VEKRLEVAVEALERVTTVLLAVLLEVLAVAVAAAEGADAVLEKVPGMPAPPVAAAAPEPVLAKSRQKVTVTVTRHPMPRKLAPEED